MLENSSWHQKQLLGTRPFKSDRLKLPQMKKSFKKRATEISPKKKKRRMYRISSPLKSVIRRTNKKHNSNTLAYTLSNPDLASSNLQTLEFNLEDRAPMLESTVVSRELESLSRSQGVPQNSKISTIKNSSQTITFGARSKGREGSNQIAEVVSEEKSDHEDSMSQSQNSRATGNFVTSEVYNKNKNAPKSQFNSAAHNP